MELRLVMGALIGLALCAPANAQVYRCKSATGATTYSQQPCGAGAEEVQVRGGDAAPSASPAGDANRRAIQQSTAISTAAITERNCLVGSESDIYGPTNRRAADTQRQITGLNQQLGRANNNLAGATWQAGIRQQISSLQQTITADRASADSQMVSARQVCGEARRSSEAAIRERFSDKPAAG